MTRTLASALLLLPLDSLAAQATGVPGAAGSGMAQTTPAVAPAAGQVSRPAVTNPLGLGVLKANPYGRAINLTVNVQFFQQDLGEVRLSMAADGATAVDSQDMLAALKPLLNDAGRAKLEVAVTGRQALDLHELSKDGIEAYFDNDSVAIEIRSIDAKLRKPLSLYAKTDDSADRATNASPAGFSAFLNTSIFESRLWNGPRAGFRDPSIFLNAAIRAGPLVFEGAGQFADRNPGAVNRQYQFDRNYLRAVYDIPSKFTRVVAGDLTPDTRFQQNFVQMGGVGISRQRRRFDEFRSAVLQGNRQLILQREATVEVYRNGELFQQLQLAPGSYDLSNLPLLSGSNDIRLAVKDAAGVSQTINYETYLDPIDLDPGDYELGAYFGKLSNQFGLSPKYDGEVAFSGFFRKAFVAHPAIGFGLQTSRSVQQISGQTQFLVGGGGRIDVTVGASHSRLGKGYLVGAAYDLALDQGFRSTTIGIQGVFQSRYFTGLGAPFQTNTQIFNGTVRLSHTFNPNLSLLAGATFVHNHKPLKDDYRIFTQAYYRISRKLSFRAGIDYQHSGQPSPFTRNGFGVNFGIVYQPRIEDRAELRYDQRRKSAQLSYEHSPNAYVGSLSYGGLLADERGQTSAQGYATYIGNRLDASVSHSLSGTGFSGITNQQITTLRLSSAIGFADGAIAVTPRIGDSFAILTPHPSLRRHHVVVGHLLTDSRYQSRSGTLGGAVVGSMASYFTRSIEYDVENPPVGYDLGLGVYRVRPPYHSGYHIVIGNDAYVTAVGTLLEDVGKPVQLGTGQLFNMTRPNEPSSMFFTNSAGRLALAKLRPGDRYAAKLSSGRSFEFTVPRETDGLLDLHTLNVNAK